MKSNRKIEALKQSLKVIGIKLTKIPMKKKYNPFEDNFKSSISYPYEQGRKEVLYSKSSLFLVTTIMWKFADKEIGKDLSRIHKNQYVMTLSEIFKFKKKPKIIQEDIINIQPYEETHENIS